MRFYTSAAGILWDHGNLLDLEWRGVNTKGQPSTTGGQDGGGEAQPSCEKSFRWTILGGFLLMGLRRSPWSDIIAAIFHRFPSICLLLDSKSLSPALLSGEGKVRDKCHLIQLRVNFFLIHGFYYFFLIGKCQTAYWCVILVLSQTQSISMYCVLGGIDTKANLKETLPLPLWKGKLAKFFVNPVYATSLTYFKLWFIINV